MREQGIFPRVIFKLKDKSARTIVSVAVVAAAIPATVVAIREVKTQIGETRDINGIVVLDGILPLEGNMLVRKPGISPKGKKID